MNPESDSKNSEEATDERKIEALHQIANAARAYEWKRLLELLRKNPEFINETRPEGQSQFTPLHQAAHGGAPMAVIQELLTLGASPTAKTAKTAKGDLAVDLAEKRAHQQLVAILQPLDAARKRATFSMPEEVENAQVICALRFKGYEYVESTGRSSNPIGELPSLVKPIVESLVLHTDQNDNFAAFFALQRGLFKWGGEYLTKYSDQHIAFDFLFLHLYRCTPPASLRHEEYCEKWERNFLPTAESIAAVVRKGFRRAGEGKALAL